MKKINTGRVWGGGLVAGLVIFIVEGFVNVAVLGGAWKDWESSMAGALPPMSPSSLLLLWVLTSLVSGMAGVWIYAGIRPRYGAGPKTALRAAFLVWLANWLNAALAQWTWSNFPILIVVGACVGGLVAGSLGVLAGAYIYKE